MTIPFKEFRVRRDSLVKELVSSRVLLFQMIIDWCKECGKESESLGWQWLLDHHKYPSRRRGKSTRNKWGWSFNSRHLEYLESIIVCEDQGPTILPYCLLDAGDMDSTVVPFPEDALRCASLAMGYALSRYRMERDGKGNWVQGKVSQEMSNNT